MIRFVQLLPLKRQQTFLENRGMMDELAALVEQQRSWSEAAAVCEKAGDLLKAAGLHEAHGQPLASAQLLLRHVRLLLLWPESLGLPAAAAKQHSVQLLMRIAQLQAGIDGSAADAAAREALLYSEAESAMLAGLARGFSSMQQLQQWMAANAGAAAVETALCSAVDAQEATIPSSRTAADAKTRLLVAVEGFSYSLRLMTSSSTAGQAAAIQLVQQWQQLQSELLPVLGAVDNALRLSEAPSKEQQQLLAACEFYMCVRPSKDQHRAAFKVAERSGMLWCLGQTQHAAANHAGSSAADHQPAAGSAGAAFTGSTLQLNTSSMLERAAAYWRWWLANQGWQLARLLEQHWVCSSSSSSCVLPQSSTGIDTTDAGSSSSSSDVGIGLYLLLQAWDIAHALLQHVNRGRTAAAQQHSHSSVVGGHRSTSIAAVTAALADKLLEVQQSALQHVATALLLPSYACGASHTAATLRSLLQQQHRAELVNQLAAAVVQGGIGMGGLAAAASRRHCYNSRYHRADAVFRPPPPPPQPEGLTYDRIGQLCLLAPLLDPDWVPRAALQGVVVMRRPAGSHRSIPWLRLLQAADWLGKSRSSDVFSPPGEWTQYYPACQYAWRCCIGLRDYLESLGVLPDGLSGGLMPHTLCSLLELAVVSACAVTTNLHNLVLPQAMAARSMSGQGMQQMYCWVVWHGSSRQEKVEMQQELLRLAKQIAALLLREDRGFPAWCKAAASVLGFQAGLPASYVDERLAYQVQEVTAQQLFWLLFVIAANNRPAAAAAHRIGSSSRPPLPMQIQDCFLDTVASLAGGGSGSSNNTAFCLLPERLRLCVLKLLAKAGARSGSSSIGQHGRSGLHSRFHGLQFDEAASELLAASAAGCSLPWAVLYCSTTRSSAPYWARKLKAIQVDDAAAAATAAAAAGAADACSLFSIEQLVQMHEAAEPGVQLPGLAAAVAKPQSLPAAAAAPAGDAEQQQQGLGRQRPSAAEAEQEDCDEDAAAGAAPGKLDEDDDVGTAAATLAGAGFLRTWVHWRLLCWKARAVVKLNRQLSQLQRLQLEAKAVLASAGEAAADDCTGVAGSQSGGSSNRDARYLAAAGAATDDGNDQYLQLYLTAVCPVMVSGGAALPGFKSSCSDLYNL
jgi:hypothetical protein